MKKPCGEKKQRKNSSAADFIFGAKVIFFLLLGDLSTSSYLFLLLTEF